MTKIDMQDPDISARFAKAPIYRKHVVVEIREVPVGTKVVTTLANGHHETTFVADEDRRWVVTNPGGERYLINAEKVEGRYDHLGGTRYAARGRVRAFANPYGHNVTIDAPWGTEQHGDRNVVFAEGVIDGDRYFIGNDEFLATYGPDFDDPDAA